MRVKSLTILLVLLLPPGVFAGKQQVNENVPAEDLPDADLLEFIAEFEPLDGHWIDPVQLNMMFAKNRKGKDNE